MSQKIKALITILIVKSALFAAICVRIFTAEAGTIKWDRSVIKQKTGFVIAQHQPKNTETDNRSSVTAVNVDPKGDFHLDKAAIP
jgi:hypothetical protein